MTSAFVPGRSGWARGWVWGIAAWAVGGEVVAPVYKRLPPSYAGATGRRQPRTAPRPTTSTGGRVICSKTRTPREAGRTSRGRESNDDAGGFPRGTSGAGPLYFF